MGMGAEQTRLVSYSGDVISMYTHCGTHLDTLNHFGYCGEIWNGYRADRDLGSRHWAVCGAELMPPIIARGVLIDVAAALGVEVLSAFLRDRRGRPADGTRPSGDPGSGG